MPTAKQRAYVKKFDDIELTDDQKKLIKTYFFSHRPNGWVRFNHPEMIVFDNKQALEYALKKQDDANS